MPERGAAIPTGARVTIPQSLVRSLAAGLENLRAAERTIVTLTRRALAFGLFLPLVGSCAAKEGADPTPTPPSSDDAAFGSPQRVTIRGYDGDVMEPFLSRDGQLLFFNDNAGGATDKDLFYAARVDRTTFAFRGEVGGVNTSAVDGAPTLDASDRFYYVSTARYAPPNAYDTLFGGRFDRATGRVTGLGPLAGLAIRAPGRLNFDVEVSPDGNTLYFNDGVFSGNPFPDEADIAVAVKRDSVFERLPNSDALMANVNTSDLEYAPAISADGLELFFTRLNLDRLEAAIMRAPRPDVASPFAPPQRVSAMTGFVEGPSLSPDGRTLYYHRQENGTFVLYCVTR
jgi:hypothetical protein